MNLSYSVILCLFFKSSSCQQECVKETIHDTEFSINVTKHIEVEAGECIDIPYEIKIPINKVTTPYRKIWFRISGDQRKKDQDLTVFEDDYVTEDVYRIHGLPRGEYEYGFKLEWECNQTYVFPVRVRISVSALTEKPYVIVPPMEEGRAARLYCDVPRLCDRRAKIIWTKTTAGGRSRLLEDYDSFCMRDGFRRMQRACFTPTADDHNTSITCVADYGYVVAETSVTLNVKFSPKILNSSQCMVDGKLVVCVCVSRGNPAPPVTWPSASLTDFSVSSSSSILTVSSTFTTPATDYHNTSVKCISSNEMGRAEIDIPLQNFTNNIPTDLSNVEQKSPATTSWVIAGVSFSLNLLLLTTLIICIHRRNKHTQKEDCEERNTYVSLKLADVEQEYSVISPQAR